MPNTAEEALIIYRQTTESAFAKIRVAQFDSELKLFDSTGRTALEYLLKQGVLVYTTEGKIDIPKPTMFSQNPLPA